MIPQRTDQPIVSVPNSLRDQFSRAESLIKQSELALANGDPTLANIHAHAASQVLLRIAETCPVMAGLVCLAERGVRAIDYDIVDRTDRYQVIERTFLGIPIGKEVVSVPTIRRFTVRGRMS